MKVYMDVCCLNRPFDDQSYDKVRFETEAVISILKLCEAGGEWILTGSDIIDIEISKNQDPVKKQKVSLLHNIATERIVYNTVIKSRAAEFLKSGVKLFDSLHLAAAEYANADVFLTTDAQLMKAAARLDIRFRIINPLVFYLEVLNG